MDGSTSQELALGGISVLGHTRRSRSGKSVRVKAYTRKPISQWLSEPGWPWEVGDMWEPAGKAMGRRPLSAPPARRLMDRMAKLDAQLAALQRERTQVQDEIAHMALSGEVDRLVAFNQEMFA